MSNISKNDINYINKITSIIDNISPKDINTIDNISGIYMITYLSGKRYIGSSKNIRKRLIAHNSYSNDELKIKFICLYLTNSDIDLKLIEGALIRKLRPEINRTNPIAERKPCVVKVSDDYLDKIKEIKKILYYKYDTMLTLEEVACHNIIVSFNTIDETSKNEYDNMVKEISEILYNNIMNCKLTEEEHTSSINPEKEAYKIYKYYSSLEENKNVAEYLSKLASN